MIKAAMREAQDEYTMYYHHGLKTVVFKKGDQVVLNTIGIILPIGSMAPKLPQTHKNYKSPPAKSAKSGPTSIMKILPLLPSVVYKGEHEYNIKRIVELQNVGQKCKDGLQTRVPPQAVQGTLLYNSLKHQSKEDMATDDPPTGNNLTISNQFERLHIRIQASAFGYARDKACAFVHAGLLCLASGKGKDCVLSHALVWQDGISAQIRRCVMGDSHVPQRWHPGPVEDHLIVDYVSLLSIGVGPIPETNVRLKRLTVMTPNTL
ncbi:hypothetical protein BDK51DRAFT_42384 [Blyttiomyces helicus]|uniref:Uncharacterized protein n=1 Tax=Blyttiomyces helicus TaxID=388810 RepID=A0A4P9WMK4_9FUNG|nr:hypothetical protein BDK51DRAFT_42384 [Blyttiomyces helicus]|eukprot:RKO94144.1 hypothetical protein BDK51DRAFT_42384 [Blyttiomyces helicus]